MNWRETYEFMINHCSVTHNFSGCEFKAWKKFRPEYDLNPWPLRYIPVQWSTNWAIKPTGRWSHWWLRNIPSCRMWRTQMNAEYMIFHIFICMFHLLWVNYELTTWSAPSWLDNVAQLVEPFADIIEVVHSNPIQVWIFFSGLNFTTAKIVCKTAMNNHNFTCNYVK